MSCEYSRRMRSSVTNLPSRSRYSRRSPSTLPISGSSETENRGEEIGASRSERVARLSDTNVRGARRASGGRRRGDLFAGTRQSQSSEKRRACQIVSEACIVVSGRRPAPDYLGSCPSGRAVVLAQGVKRRCYAPPVALTATLLVTIVRPACCAVTVTCHIPPEPRLAFPSYIPPPLSAP